MKKIKIGLLGLGVVGSGSIDLLRSSALKIKELYHVELIISKALAHSQASIDKREGLDDFNLTLDIDDIINDPEIAIVLELMGTIEPAKSYIMKALKAHKHVISANKDLIAQHGMELITCANDNKVSFYYEAAVCGGIPLLRTITNSYASDDINKVIGIVNGTTNYILTKMNEERVSYEVALLEAQRLGFAESDPTNDVLGYDAAFKMGILTYFAYGMFLKQEDIIKDGITNIKVDDLEYATNNEYLIKLVGSSIKYSEGIYVEVMPTLINKKHLLAHVNNEMNGVYIYSNALKEALYYAPGAGALPTANSVISDVLQVVKDINNNTYQRFNHYNKPVSLASNQEIIASYYFNIKINKLDDLKSLIAQVSNAKMITNVTYKEIDDNKQGYFIIKDINNNECECFTKNIININGEIINKFKVID
ncbi:MAG: homoserine dehydrogenase [Bacilli bacterium]|jgi:homoserine dehydrogenase|nr:homoserine dehydrogenase [Bacilli bacterium]